MNPFLPPSTNADYAGAPAAAWFLTVYGVLGLLPGMIHSFAPDGGAGSIAGIDLSRDGGRTVALFAWAGATQIVHGVVNVIIGWRYRSLVPLFLLISLLERLLLVWTGWVAHVPMSGQHPPAHYGSLIAVPLILLFLWLSLRRSARLRSH
jgi:hypothetical protein